MNKEQLVDWIEEHNEYEFLWNEDWEYKKLLETKKIIEKMDKILKATAEKIKKLEKSREGKRAGIGDTATDEAIVSNLYSMIH